MYSQYSHVSPTITEDHSQHVLRLLLAAEAALQEAGGQHLPRIPGGRPRHRQHAETDLLRGHQPREVGQDRRVSLLQDQQGPQQELPETLGCHHWNGGHGRAAQDLPLTLPEPLRGELPQDCAEAS